MFISVYIILNAIDFIAGEIVDSLLTMFILYYKKVID
jgi:hypothetical protein